MSPTRLFLVVAAVLLLVGSPAHAYAQAGKDSKEDADPKVVEADKEQAKLLLDRLEKAKKDKKNTNGIVKAIEPLVTRSNEKFVKPLDKLAKHREVSVRVMAVRALGSQVPAKKVGPVLFGILQDRTKRNKKSPQVIAHAIASLRRLKFDKKPVADEITRQFRKVVHTSIMKECVKYFGDLRKKDTVKMLVYWVEAPQPGMVDDPSNPPSSYWEKLWNVWDEIKDDVLDALRKITGQEFTKKSQWEKWVRSPAAKRMGIK
jgi:hypothetical protein